MKMCAINTFRVQVKGSASHPNVTETLKQDKLFPSHFTNEGTHQGNSVEKSKTKLRVSRALQMMFISYSAMTTEKLTERAKGSPSADGDLTNQVHVSHRTRVSGIYV